MQKLKAILGIAIFILAVVAGWQIGSCELANVELQDDLRDLASQLGTRTGLTPPPSDEDLRNTVIRKAKIHDLDLMSDQVTVQHMGSGDAETVYLAANYTVPIKLLGFSFTLHFTPSSQKKR